MFEQNKKQELTSRQKEILTLLRKGLTNNEICKTLDISPNTVKVHLTKIYKILEVTNRTEAVTSGSVSNIENDDTPEDLNIIFRINENISQHPTAQNLYLSIVEGIHQYRTFRISEALENCPNPGFQIDVSYSKAPEETLHFATRIGNTNELLWTTSAKINTNDIASLARKSSIHLFRNLLIASTKLRHNPDIPIPYWWIAATYCYAKLENRSQDSFETCKQVLSPIVEKNSYSEVALYTLSLAYYYAILENWGNIQENSAKLCEFAHKAMHNAPYSIYSQMIMALYNITIGNKSEAIAYFKQVVEANPQMVMARTLLTQIYMLTGQAAQAMELIDDTIRSVPESALQTTYQARAFILLLQGKYNECKKLANQILMFTPTAMAIRLIAIACCNILSDTAESEAHTQKLFEHYPKITISDVEQLLKGVNEPLRSFLIGSVQSIFTKK